MPDPSPKPLKKMNKRLVAHGKHKMFFNVPNGFCEWRVKTIFTKEPVTIQWLSSFKPNETFWDVGANIGLYSIFATLVSQVKTYAFEPESQNYQTLNENIFLNNLHFRIRAFCLGLSNTKSIGELALSKVDTGHSGHDIRPVKTQYLKYTQGCFITTCDSLIRMGLPIPTHLKIDVDGVEPLIIQGINKNIKQVKTILIEINEKDKEHINLIRHIQDQGFYFDQEQVDSTKRPKDMDPYFQSFREYIFRRRD